MPSYHDVFYRVWFKLDQTQVQDMFMVVLRKYQLKEKHLYTYIKDLNKEKRVELILLPEILSWEHE